MRSVVVICLLLVGCSPQPHAPGSSMLTLYETQCHSGHAYACRMARESRGEPASPELDRIEALTAASPASPPTGANPDQAQANQDITEVALRPQSGAFVVPVRINDSFSLNFILDSGAADVTIPADVVLTLMRLGTINASDFLGTRLYRMADGSTVPSKMFVIHKLDLGGRRVTNVTGSVAPVNGALLLGQTFLARFKTWSIDNRRHVLVLK